MQNKRGFARKFSAAKRRRKRKNRAADQGYFLRLLRLFAAIRSGRVLVAAQPRYAFLRPAQPWSRDQPLGGPELGLRRPRRGMPRAVPMDVQTDAESGQAPNVEPVTKVGVSRFGMLGTLRPASRCSAVFTTRDVSFVAVLL